MQKHEVRALGKGSSVERNKKPVKHDDLVELVLGPLADQMDRARLEILAAIQRVNESVEIVAREFARQAKREE